MSVSVDFVHVDGQTLVLVVNDNSRIPFVEPVSSTSASAVIPKLDQLFSTFGAPPVVKSENGPPFNEEEFAKFACPPFIVQRFSLVGSVIILPLRVLWTTDGAGELG